MDKQIIYCTNLLDWRNWLESHYKDEKEIWFVFPTVSSGEIGVTYNDAVEEALCFGWIDGVAGALDEKHQLRRFTPRRKGSPYSRLNIERLIALDEEGKLKPEIRNEVLKLITSPYVFPKDIIKVLKKDKTVWENYQNFSESYKRIRIAYIDHARDRPEEFKKRLDNFIKKTKDNKLILGYGGTDKYYK